MANETLEDLLNSYIKNFKYTNIGTNYGTYVPQDTKVKEDKTTKNLGYNYRWRDTDVAYINPERHRDQYGILNTFAHEAAHTVQPRKDAMLNKIGLGNHAPLKRNKYEHYEASNPYPPPEEALASLRASEALQRKGKTIWDTITGQEYLEETVRNNPKWSKEDAKRFIDRRMFPEYSVMHEWKPSTLEEIIKYMQKIPR